MSNPELERQRRLWVLDENTAPADPEVVGRRKYHEGTAKWLAKWAYLPHALFAATGFFVVLLPALSKTWHEIIVNIPIAARIFHDFSTLSGWALALLGAEVTLSTILHFMGDDYPGGWHPAKQRGYPTLRETTYLELYPRTRAEERIFWVRIAVGELAYAMFWLIGFGVFVFFIRIGG